MSLQSELNPVLERNIAAMRERQTAANQQRSTSARLIDHISEFAGSLRFIVVNLLFVTGWVLVNIGALANLPRFDTTFVGLATAVSVESLVLSAFILISQNRAAAMERRRAELDVHIGLLAEHEITRLIHITTAIADHLGIDIPRDDEVEKLKDDVAPDAVLDKLESTDQ